MQLSLANAIGEGFSSAVDLGADSLFLQVACHLLRVGGVPLHHREDRCLDRGKPHGKGPSVMFNQYAQKPLQRAEQGAVDHVGAMLLAVLPDVDEVKPLGKVEVKLDGGQLPAPVEGILDLDVDLRAVEDRLALDAGIGKTPPVQGLGQRRLGPLPVNRASGILPRLPGIADAQDEFLLLKAEGAKQLQAEVQDP